MTDKHLLPDEAILDGILSANLNDVIFYIYRQHADYVVFNVAAMGGSLQDGEDIFQETVVTFIDLVQKQKFRGDSSIKTFLTSIAKHIWLNELKRRKSVTHRESRFGTERDQVDNDLLDNYEQQEVKAQFLALIGQLGGSCRQVLSLFYYDNLTFAEIMEKMGYENEQVVRNKKYKCLKELTELVRNNPLLMTGIK
jgi:RNA polymerase sigma factor (sigma-70 family)